MKKLHYIFSFIVLALSSSALIYGCSNTAETPPQTNNTVTPKSGTTYTYQKHQVDSSAATGAVSTDSTIVDTVIASGTAYNGKTNVITVIDDFDTLRYMMESNNDVSIYLAQFGTSGFDFTNPRPWMRLPFGSKQSGVQLFDTVETLLVQGSPTDVHINGVADYIGADQLTTTTGKNVSGGQVRTTITALATVLGTEIKIVATQTYSFDGSIGGYFHSISNTAIPDVTIFGQSVFKASTSNKEMKLTNYTLIQ